MKYGLIILGLTVVIFLILTFSTAEVETPFDGDDTYGFPLTFFIRFSGMCKPCPPNETETFYLKLLVDILFALLLAILVLAGFKKAKKVLYG